MGTFGSPRKATIDGIPFNIAADANIAQNDRVEVEDIPHSGGNAFKVTTVGGSAESVKLTVAPSEYVQLIALRNSAMLSPVPLSYEEADGTVNRTFGAITLGPRQTEDGSCDVTMMSSTGEWEIFSAS
jgi:hypothetical protein